MAKKAWTMSGYPRTLKYHATLTDLNKNFFKKWSNNPQNSTAVPQLKLGIKGRINLSNIKAQTQILVGPSVVEIISTDPNLTQKQTHNMLSKHVKVELSSFV